MLKELLDGKNPRDVLVSIIEAKDERYSDGELECGFSIATSDQHIIEGNAEERDINLDSDAWKILTNDSLQIERNVLRWLNKKIGSFKDEGHSGDELLGSCSIKRKKRKVYDYVMEHYDDRGEARSTDADDEKDFYKGVSDLGSDLIDVYIRFFDIDEDEWEYWDDNN